MSRFLLLLLMLPSVALGGMLPSLDDQPIIRSDNPRYSDAAYNLQKAMLRQLGITDMYSKLDGYVTDKANTYQRAYVPKPVVDAIGAVYVIGVKKHISRSFNDPWFTGVTHSVDLTPTGGSTGITFQFPNL